ncbi:MAG: sensor histidine kinase, partial [Gemmatimonadaceae bacterium]
ELGLAGPLTAQQHDYLTRLSASSRHLLGLVNDVLDLAKIDAGETRIAHDAVLTAPAVTAALDLTRPQAAARGVRLVAPVENAPAVAFIGDEHRVRQLLVNLLSNAIKFTPPGGTVTVTCRTAELAGRVDTLCGAGWWAHIRVEDTGIGVPLKEQSRIFEPFVQVEAGHTRTQGGTGLGLAISRRLARLMGGDLSLESTPGKGSAFTLCLPASERVRDEAVGASGAGAERHSEVATPGIEQIGEMLRASLEDILRAYTDRLRAESMIPGARVMRQAHLEDHAVSLLADLAQSLVILSSAGDETADLLRDGSAIQHAVAQAHGARRFAQGWPEAAVRRDHQILREEVERAVRGRLPKGSANADAALEVLLGLIDRAESVSVSAWRRAGSDRGILPI